jgi:hypothetical protein
MITMAEIRQRNRAAGYHYFSKATMRFFASRIESRPYAGPGGVFFITSEQYLNAARPGAAGPRLYSVRRFDTNTGECFTEGQFHRIGQIEEARRLARQAAKGEKGNDRQELQDQRPQESRQEDPQPSGAAHDCP